MCVVYKYADILISFKLSYNTGNIHCQMDVVCGLGAHSTKYILIIF